MFQKAGGGFSRCCISIFFTFFTMHFFYTVDVCTLQSYNGESKEFADVPKEATKFKVNTSINIILYCKLMFVLDNF